MHVLLIQPYFLPPGAAGSVRWNQMARHWVEAGHRVTVLAGSIDYLTGRSYVSGENQHENDPSESRVQVIRVAMSSSYNRGRWGRMWAYWTFFWNSLWAGLFLVEDDVDVVLATSPPLTVGLTGLILARLRRCPFVLEVRDLWPEAPVQLGYLTRPMLVRLAYRLERFLYRMATHIVALTPAFEQVLIEQKGVLAAHCTTISNGADFDLTDTVLNRFDRTNFRRENQLEDRFWIIYAGAHGAANGLMTVIEAAESMQQEPIGFLLLGDGPQKDLMQAETSWRGLANIRFLPALPKSETLRWIAAADAGLVIMQPIPIFQTMLSAKLFDYLACRKPVLTAIDGLTRQLAEKQKFGLFLDPKRPDIWHKQICLYIAQPMLVKDHGENGRQYAHQTADRTALAHRYLTILNRVYQLHQTRP